MTKAKTSRINEEIEANEVRLISSEGEQIGIVPFEEALERAREEGLDLMEVAPNASPPVCKIVNYGKLKYEEKKKLQQSKKKQHFIKVKEVRIRPGISENDLLNKINQGKKFLHDGCKLKVTVMYRGRELSRIDLGEQIMERVIDMLSDVADVEKQSELEGRRMSFIFSSK
ncbi:MAG: translation initiation factor IF-3 [Fidelibacterota bacterium]